MAFIKIVLAIGVLAIVAEGHYNVFPNPEFGGLPQIPFQRSVLVPPPPVYPRVTYPVPLYYPPGPLKEVPVPLYYDDFEPSQYPLYPEPKRFWPSRSDERIVPIPVSSPYDRGFSLTVSSASDGNNGMTMVTTNENGQTQTFFSPSPRERQFYRVPSPSRSQMGMTHLVKMAKKLTGQAFEMAGGIPEIRIPEFPKMPKMLPIDKKAKSSKYQKYHAKAEASSFHMTSENGEKPKIVSEYISITNNNGKINKKHKKYDSTKTYRDSSL